MPSGKIGSTGSCALSETSDALGSPRNRPCHALLGVIQPVFDRSRNSLGSKRPAQLLETPLANPRGADQREKVAAPLCRHPDAPFAHADDIVVDRAPALHEDAGEDERTLLVHIAREGVIGGGCAIADIGLMRLGAGREHVHPVDEHRHQDRVIGRMGIAEVRIVVEEGIAFLQVRMKGTH